MVLFCDLAVVVVVPWKLVGVDEALEPPCQAEEDDGVPGVDGDVVLVPLCDPAVVVVLVVDVGDW